MLHSYHQDSPAMTHCILPNQEPPAEASPSLASCVSYAVIALGRVLIQAVEDKVKNRRKQKNNVDRDGKSENQKEILEIKNTVIEMKNDLGWLKIRLETAEE